MTKHSLLIITGAVVVSVSGMAAVHFYDTRARAETKAPIGFSGQASVNTEDTANQPTPVDLITVAAPFTNYYTRQVSEPVVFRAPGDNDFSEISAITPLGFSGNQLVLPVSFVGQGPDNTDLSSNQPTSLIQKITFQKEGSVVWESDDGTGSPNYTWAEHPEHLIVPAGGTAVITYTNSGKDSHWTGTVKIQ